MELTREEKRMATIIKNYGSWEAYVEQQKQSGSKGGKTTGASKSRGREHYVAIGRKGGLSRGKK